MPVEQPRSARLEHSSGTATHRATRSGDKEGPERGPHGPVAVGARRWVGRWESSLSQVEQGKTGVGSYSVLTWMGTVLQVEVEKFDRRGGGDGEEGQRVYESTAEIERAMMAYEVAMR